MHSTNQITASRQRRLGIRIAAPWRRQRKTGITLRVCVFAWSLLFATSFLFSNPCQAQTDLLDSRFHEGENVPTEVQTIYERGTRFLQQIQREDGSFTRGGGMHGNESAGISSLCVMAWLSTGEDPNFGKYANNIRKALRHIIRSQNPKSGYIPGNMYVHGFSMLALAEAYGAVDDEMLWAGHKPKDRRSIGKALELAVRLAVDSQKKNPSKGWRYSPNERSADTSVVGAVLMGLLAARNAGIAVPDESIDGALGYMKSMTDDRSGMVGYMGFGGMDDSAARSSIACLVFAIGKRREFAEFKSTSKRVADGSHMANSGFPYYTRYYQAQALFQSDHEMWAKWNSNITRKLGEMQTDSGQIGNSDHGPAYSTAMSLLALALNYRFLPIYER